MNHEAVHGDYQLNINLGLTKKQYEWLETAIGSLREDLDGLVNIEVAIILLESLGTDPSMILRLWEGNSTTYKLSRPSKENNGTNG